MARSKTLPNVYAREVYNTVSSGALTLDTSAYAIDDYLHTGVITFGDIFLEDYDSYLEIHQLKVTENSTSLTMVPFQLWIFDSCDITVTANGAFTFTAGTTIDNVLDVITVETSDYTVRKSGGNSYDAVALVTIAKPIKIKATTGQTYLKAIAVATSTPTITSGATIKLELGVKCG